MSPPCAGERAVAGRFVPSRVAPSVQRLLDRLVADLRTTASRYPTDRALRRLIGDLAAGSPRFAEPGTEDAERLELAAVLGTQTLAR